MGYLEYQISEIRAFLDREEEKYRIAFANKPEGTLQRLRVGESINYVHSVPDPNTKGRYIRRGITRDKKLVTALATKEYARTALSMIKRNRHLLDGYEEKARDLDPETIKCGMKAAYQDLPPYCFNIDTAYGSQDSYLREWAESDYEQSDYMYEKRIIRTSRGLMVRSKSELFLAEKLYSHHIPFRYEQVIRIGSHTLVPDFTFLGRNREEFYLEYCGRMDDPDYVRRFLWKRDMYERAGITEWDNMIYVYERNNEIDMVKIDLIINASILPNL